MTKRGAQRVESVRDALVCPQCQYSLCGLAGDQVTCPECGQSINVTQLVANQWNRPWHQAPLFNLLALPSAVLFVGFAGGMIVLIVMDSAGPDPPEGWKIIAGAAGAITLILWIAALELVRRKFGGMEGVWLALLVPVLLAAYLSGIFWFIGSLLGLLMAFSQTRVAQQWPIALVGLVFSSCVLALARMSEKFIARRCIKRHLRLAAVGGSINGHDKR